jgi:hypothetical protein
MNSKAEKRRKRKKLAKLITSAKFPKIRIPIAKPNQSHKTINDYDRKTHKLLKSKGFDET